MGGRNEGGETAGEVAEGGDVGGCETEGGVAEKGMVEEGEIEVEVEAVDEDEVGDRVEETATSKVAKEEGNGIVDK